MINKYRINIQSFSVLLVFCLVGLMSCKQEASKTINNGANATKATTEDVKEKMSKTSTKVAETMQDKAMETKRAMKESMSEAKESMNDMKEMAKGKVAIAKEEMVKKTQVAASSKEALNDKVDEMKKEMPHASEEVTKVITKAGTAATSVVTTSTNKAEPSKPALEAREEVAEEMEKVEVAQPKKKKPVAAAAGPNHKVFDDILRANVSSSGKVDYAGIKANMSKLQGYLDELATTNIKGLNRNEQLAYWINAYNAFTIKKIIDNYPIGSITDLDGGKPWDSQFIKLGGTKYTLNNIENDIIRPQFREPRIHFAVNCAAKSCPPLLNRAWTASNLETNFEKQTKAFINNSQHNAISSGSAQVSKIFEWYGEDFGDLKAYLNKYAKTKIGDGVTIGFKDYDWSLNN